MVGPVIILARNEIPHFRSAVIASLFLLGAEVISKAIPNLLGQGCKHGGVLMHLVFHGPLSSSSACLQSYPDGQDKMLHTPTCTAYQHTDICWSNMHINKRHNAHENGQPS